MKGDELDALLIKELGSLQEEFAAEEGMSLPHFYVALLYSTFKRMLDWGGEERAKSLIATTLKEAICWHHEERSEDEKTTLDEGL